eukprot:gene6318-biopygen8755
MEYAAQHIAREYRCGRGEPHLTFLNGTRGNSTKCVSWKGCSANVTLCLADGGHRWYGDHYARTTVCEWEGWPADECSWEDDEAEYLRLRVLVCPTSHAWKLLAPFGVAHHTHEDSSSSSASHTTLMKTP